MCMFVRVRCCDGHVGEVTDKCYGNGDQGQWDVALEALMALFSADPRVTQESIYSLHLIHELRGWDGTESALSQGFAGSVLAPAEALTAVNELPGEEDETGSSMLL